MVQYIGCDVHKKYSMFVAVDENGRRGVARRVVHDRAGFRAFLEELAPGSPIAVETRGNWYWIIDEMERAGHFPCLAHAAKSKAMMGHVNKTDKLDATDLAVLLRNGTLPSVWIPGGDLRDQRELPRMRLVLVQMRTALKCRIYVTFSKYGITFDGVSDLFGVRGHRSMAERMAELPPETRRTVEQELGLLGQIEEQIHLTEKRIRQVIAVTPAIKPKFRLVVDMGRICGTPVLLATSGLSPADRGPAVAEASAW